MNAIVVFVAATYSLSIVLSLIVGLTGGHDSGLAGLAYVPSTLSLAGAALIVTTTLNDGHASDGTISLYGIFQSRFS